MIYAAPVSIHPIQVYAEGFMTEWIAIHDEDTCPGHELIYVFL